MCRIYSIFLLANSCGHYKYCMYCIYYFVLSTLLRFMYTLFSLYSTSYSGEVIFLYTVPHSVRLKFKFPQLKKIMSKLQKNCVSISFCRYSKNIFYNQHKIINSLYPLWPISRKKLFYLIRCVVFLKELKLVLVQTRH